MIITKSWYCCSSAPAWKKHLKTRVWWWWVYFFSCSPPPSSCSLILLLSYISVSPVVISVVWNLSFLNTHSLPPARTLPVDPASSHTFHTGAYHSGGKWARGRVHPKPLCPRLAPSSSSPFESTFTSENAKITVLMTL